MKLSAIFVLVAVLFAVGEGQSLSRLYNMRVVRAERWERPLMSGGSSGYHGSKPWQYVASKLGFKHSGVVVTLQNGSRWLVHKGDEYGNSSQTVVTSARNMGSRWSRTASKRVSRSRVRDYVRAGGRTYNIVWDNCHSASRRMMRLS